jgi:hypothetical protein
MQEAVARGLIPVLVVFFVTPTVACYPIAAHPTRIEPGVALTTGVSAQVTLDSSLEHDPKSSIRPSMAIGLAAGFTDSLEDGLKTRIAAGLGMASYFADLYFEMPRSAFGEWDAGFGVTTQWVLARTVIPYLQFGRDIGDGVALFGSVGLAIFDPDSLPRQRRLAATVGMSLASERPHAFGRGGVTSFYTTVLPGATRVFVESYCVIVCSDERHTLGSSLVIIGVSGELKLQRTAGGGRPRPPPGRSR